MVNSDWPGQQRLADWAWGLVGDGLPAMIALFGPPGMGVSHLFEWLAVTQPHATVGQYEGLEWLYWDLSRARLTTDDQFWLALARLLTEDPAVAREMSDLNDYVTSTGLSNSTNGYDPELAANRVAWLSTVVEKRKNRGRIVVVLDGWDQARSGPQPGVPGNSLGDLSAALYDAAQQQTSPFSLIVATHRANAADLRAWAQEMRSVGQHALNRFSLEITRWFRADVLPGLKLSESITLMRSNGLSNARAEALVRHIGGWPRVLLYAAEIEKMKNLSEEDRLRRVQKYVWNLLKERVLTSNSGDSGERERSARADLAARLRDISTGGISSNPKFSGLVIDLSTDSGPFRAAPVIDSVVDERTVLYVDVLNLINGYRKEASTGAYPEEPWRYYTAEVLPPAMQQWCLQWGVLPVDVRLVAPALERINDAFGSNWRNYGWKPRIVNAGQEVTERKSLDDELLRIGIIQEDMVQPRRRFLVLSGDIDPGLLTCLPGTLADRLEQKWPYERSRGAAGSPRPWRYEEHVFTKAGLYRPFDSDKIPPHLPLGRRPRPGDTRSQIRGPQ